jgi:hypothetical protein
MTMQSILIGVQRENLFSTITSVFAFGFDSATAVYSILGGIEEAATTEDFNFFSDQYDWLRPNSFGYNYEVRALLFDGGPVTGTFDTFIAADSSPNWSVSVSQPNQVRQGIIDFDFRRKGDTNILLSKQVTLIAETA